jgi:hypothetical protein
LVAQRGTDDTKGDAAQPSLVPVPLAALLREFVAGAESLEALRSALDQLKPKK